MLIATTEGSSWRFEVIVQSDGYLVQCRDVETGAVIDEEVTLFRTAPVALAFAGMAAAADRYASATRLDDNADILAAEFASERRRFASIRMTLCDDGINASILAARSAKPAARGPRLH